MIYRTGTIGPERAWGCPAKYCEFGIIICVVYGLNSGWRLMVGGCVIVDLWMVVDDSGCWAALRE